MKDNKEMVSAFVDGEISDRNQLDTLFDEPELQAQWQRYHLIKDNLAQDPKVELPVDFVQSVMLRSCSVLVHDFERASFP